MEIFSHSWEYENISRNVKIFPYQIPLRDFVKVSKVESFIWINKFLSFNAFNVWKTLKLSTIETLTNPMQ